MQPFLKFKNFNFKKILFYIIAAIYWPKHTTWNVIHLFIKIILFYFSDFLIFTIKMRFLLENLQKWHFFIKSNLKQLVNRTHCIFENIYRLLTFINFNLICPLTPWCVEKWKMFEVLHWPLLRWWFSLQREQSFKKHFSCAQ